MTPRDAGTTAPIRDAGSRPPHDAGVVPHDPRFDAFAAAFEAERRANNVSGAAVAIVEGGRVTFAQGFGTRSPVGGAAPTPSTLFRIGSVNKALTAAVLLGLLDQQGVAVNSPLVGVVPELSFSRDATWAPSISLEHLLTHSSGIVDHTVIFAEPSQHGDAALNDFLTGEFENIGYLMSPAGSFYNYSNPNYALAGLAIERLAQTSYREAMQTRLFEPLGMRRTFFLGTDVVADGDYATGAGFDDNGTSIVVEPDTYENAWARPAGFAYSTVLDLAAFVRFLRDGNPAVLSDARRTQMMAPQINTLDLGDLSHYGYGLSVYEGLFLPSGFVRTRVVQHDGAIPGFSASIWYVPAADFGFVLLANADGAYFFDSIVMALEEIAVMPAPTAAPDIGPDPAKNVDYVGRYSDPYEFGSIIVSQIDGRLEVILPDLDNANVPYRRELEPYTRDNFVLYVNDYPLVLTFVLDQRGRAAFVRNRLFVGTRTNTLRADPIAIDRAKLLERVARASRERGPLSFVR